MIVVERDTIVPESLCLFNAFIFLVLSWLRIPQYVPCEGETVLEPIFFDGDALTEERARYVQWTFKDGDNPFDRLEGLDTSHADWHAKANLYEVHIK